MRGLKIVGCGNALPKKVVAFGNGVRFRLDEDETLLDLVEKSTKDALDYAGLFINDIDLIIGAMATPLQAIPCNAALIHERIAKGLSIPAFDINSSCTSFITAMDIAAHLLNAGTYSRILIVSGDTASAALNPKQKESYELFSDAVSAVIVTKNDTSGVLFSKQNTWSEGAHDTEIRGGCALQSAFKMTEENHDDYYFDMKGKKVVRLALKVMPSFLSDGLKCAGMTFNDIDMVVPHQASRILGLIMPKLGIPRDKYIDKVHTYGNMVSASVPFVLNEAILRRQIVSGNIVLLIGTAAGLTANMLLLKI